MKTALVVIALLGSFVTNAYAQYEANTVLAIHSAPETASAMLGSLTSEQQDRASIFPIASLYRWPNYGGTQEFTSWAVIYTRNDEWDPDSCSYPSAFQSPIPWAGAPACGSGLFAWNTSQFTTVVDARAFYDGLAPLQKTTAVLYRVPGPVHAFGRDFVVFWQSFGLVCS